MAPMALPSVGGMTIALITLFVVPVLYASEEELRMRWRAWKASSSRAASA
jgi:Cu(I)/Ag(I) efflux system membrane protein CusA/SilA